MELKQIYNKLFKYEKVSVEYMKKQDTFMYYLTQMAVIMSLVAFLSQLYFYNRIEWMPIYVALSTPIFFYFYKNESHKIIKGLKTSV